jgi:hypothetical protein
MKVKVVDGVDFVEFKEKLKQNDYYCLCLLDKTDDNKCMCKEFRESEMGKICLCGIFVKLGDNNGIY